MHSQEPWKVVAQDDGEMFAIVDRGYPVENVDLVANWAEFDSGMKFLVGWSEENVKRIVACVNALQGVPTEYLESERLEIALTPKLAKLMREAKERGDYIGPITLKWPEN